MDKITKTILKFSKEEKSLVENTIRKIISNEFSGLDLKKLSGGESLFRVRSGKVRIVFRKRKDFNEIIYVGYRSEKTYRDF